MSPDGNLLERDGELASLETLIGEAADGQARMALVEGPRWHRQDEQGDDTDLRDAFAEGTYARLQAAKASYDPQRRFHANHEIA